MKTAVEWLMEEVAIIPHHLLKKFEQAKEMEKEQKKEMEFLKFQRDVYIKDIEILKARLREAEKNNK